MRGRCIAFLALMSMICPALAQDWPARPMRVVVPFSAASIGEILLRVIAPPMEAKLGQRFVVDAKPGAAGNIGTAEVARAALADAAIRKRIVELGHVPVGLTPAETIAFLKAESARFKGIVERGGIRLQ